METLLNWKFDSEILLQNEIERPLMNSSKAPGKENKNKTKQIKVDSHQRPSDRRFFFGENSNKTGISLLKVLRNGGKYI